MCGCHDTRLRLAREKLAATDLTPVVGRGIASGCRGDSLSQMDSFDPSTQLSLLADECSQGVGGGGVASLIDQDRCVCVSLHPCGQRRKPDISRVSATTLAAAFFCISSHI